MPLKVPEVPEMWQTGKVYFYVPGNGSIFVLYNYSLTDDTIGTFVVMVSVLEKTY